MDTPNVKRSTSGIGLIALLLVLLGFSLYLLNRATQNPEQFDALYPVLSIVTGAELIILLLLIGNDVLKLFRQYRNKATGSRLSVRLIVIFVILTVAPVSIVYYFSVEFLRRGVDSWFDIKVEAALDSALKLSQAALDERMKAQLKSTRRMAKELINVANSDVTFIIEDLRRTSSATELLMLSRSGKIIATASVNPAVIVPNYPQENILSQVRRGHDYIRIDPLHEDGLYLRIVVSVASKTIAKPRILQALVPVTKRINVLAEAVQDGYARYEQMTYLREPLKFSFVMTLSVVLVLTLFTALWAAFFAARRLVEPVRVLAIGVRLVSSGEYGWRLPLQRKDDLGYLVESFNDMTEKLAQSRDEAEQSQQRAERQKAYLEAVLTRLSSGVLVLDKDLRLRTVNQATCQVLGVNLNGFVGAYWQDIGKQEPLLTHFVDTIAEHVARKEPEWREEVTFFGAAGRQTLMCRGTALLGEAGRASVVIVFDDITSLIQVQRDAAWGEVARRLAHEIKNPLTPIQLSAERLRHKYLNTMDPEDAIVLDKATHTIVQQVGAMKEMVQAFSDYARSPRLNIKSLCLNQLIEEVVELYQGGEQKIRWLTDFDDSLPPLKADDGRIRQLLHNLIKNASEAMVNTEHPTVIFTTRRLQGNRIDTMDVIEMAINDNGPGLPKDMKGELFDPYVTNKPKGSGLGLAVVKKIVEEHGGIIRAENNEEGGACFTLRFPLPNELATSIKHDV